MKTEAAPNQMNRRKIRETAKRRVVEQAPNIMITSNTPKTRKETSALKEIYSGSTNRIATYLQFYSKAREQYYCN